MRYRAGISGAEYEAMEDGYEQGRDAERERLEKAGWVSPEAHAVAVEVAVDEVLAEFGAYLMEKAVSGGEGGSETERAYAQGIRNAAIESRVFLKIRDRWRQ